MSALLHSAIAIAHDLAESARPGGHWHGAIVGGTDDDPHVRIGDTGDDLYSGSAGIGLFLSCAARHDPTGRFANLAAEAITRSLTQAPDLVRQSRLGLYDGATGIALAALLAGRLLGDDGLVTEGEKLCLSITRTPCPSGGHDLISGTAGIIIGLTHAHRITGNPVLRDATLSLARDLKAASAPEPWGRSWPPHLTGLAHGASGPALALLETGDIEAATAAMRYERSWCSPFHGNWPDLRAQPPGYPAFWCHGAVGIGLSRLRAHELTRDTTALAEASLAIQAVRDLTIRAGTASREHQPVDLSLCHGLSGAAELLITAATVLKEDAHLRAARKIGTLMIEHRDRMGTWPCGLPHELHRGETPDLFLGTAGIGLTLLRLHDPRDAIPLSPVSWS
ncbi:lanthionine synthetase LanC family protein [Nonomuraea sp. NPDC050547]|uniref:lanthionine synthetase LanC family protein n=1 Tax=Nonomuraea sp. NPDC050547 TaxID=3364368 RepID=UPI00379FE32B